jgi:hypothetical protein
LVNAHEFNGVSCFTRDGNVAPPRQVAWWASMCRFSADGLAGLAAGRKACSATYHGEEGVRFYTKQIHHAALAREHWQRG